LHQLMLWNGRGEVKALVPGGARDAELTYFGRLAGLYAPGGIWWTVR
jgi:hypothetical protein